MQIQHDAVVIPVSLKLPAYMGGVTGQATLQADNANGLKLSSLHIGVPDLVLGALEVKDLNIDYAATGNVWTGSATVNIPAGTPYFGIAVAVRFDDGDFTMGSFDVTVPFPGVPIFTDTYLDGFGGGFDIHPDKRSFHGSVSVGAIPLDPPNYTIGVTGSVAITFINGGPVVLEADGSGSVHGFNIANAKLIFQTNGYFEVNGNVDVDLDVAELTASMDAFVDLPAKEFSANVNGQLNIAGYSAISVQAVISSLGVAACGSDFGLHAGLSYPWGGTPDASVGTGSCDLSPFVVKPVSVASVAGRTRSRAGRRGGDRRRRAVRGHRRHRRGRVPVGRPHQPERKDGRSGRLRTGRGERPRGGAPGGQDQHHLRDGAQPRRRRVEGVSGARVQRHHPGAAGARLRGAEAARPRLGPRRHPSPHLLGDDTPGHVRHVRRARAPRLPDPGHGPRAPTGRCASLPPRAPPASARSTRSSPRAGSPVRVWP